ncbi:hypothetical protein ES708_11104 [subsurface metagenome]
MGNERNMSLYDYRLSLELSKDDPTFSALIMAAMRKADTDDMSRLVLEWPEIYQEFQARFNTPGGFLTDEEAEVEERR